MIEFQNVTFTYQSTERESGVYDLNLTIPDGQIVLLCGESGCGKTTLTRLINGLTPEYYRGIILNDLVKMGNDLGATTVIFPNICHAMMLDPDWIIVAETILGVIQNKKQEVEKYRICKRENDQKSSLD